MKEFTGSLERIIYYNRESSFLVGCLRCRGGDYLCWEFPPLQIEKKS